MIFKNSFFLRKPSAQQDKAKEEFLYGWPSGTETRHPGFVAAVLHPLLLQHRHGAWFISLLVSSEIQLALWQIWEVGQVTGGKNNRA